MNGGRVDVPELDESPPRGWRIIEVAIVFSRLGFIAFGGPAAHVAIMEEELVKRRKWLSRQQFLDAFAAINFIPGPNSTELAIYLGWVRAGFAGLITAGFCFITPAVLIILPIAWAYVRYGQLAQVRGMMFGVNAVVMAIILAACLRLGKTAIRNSFELMVAVGAMVIYGLLLRRPIPHLQPDLSVLVAAAFAGIVRRLLRERRTFSFCIPLLAIPLSSATAAPASGGLLQLAGLFLKIGATLFGSGYLLVTYLQGSAVDELHWMNRGQLLDAISVGQFTPGPLLTTATFIGYVRGWQIYGTYRGAAAGAVTTTAAIFAPAFVLIALVARFLPRLRKSEWARAALDAVNAAVVALIAIAAIRLGAGMMTPSPQRHLITASLIFLISVIALLKYNASATWLVIFGAVAGVAVSMARY